MIKVDNLEEDAICHNPGKIDHVHESRTKVPFYIT